MTFKQRIARTLRPFGYDIIRYEPSQSPMARVMKLMKHHNIDLVIDVGANEGQYATNLREHGFSGNIISYEPIFEAFEKLQKATANDERWKAYNLAIGNKSGEMTINISDNSTSSSLLEMLPAHEHAAPHSRYTARERVKVSTLDAETKTSAGSHENIWLKVDTQGYEGKVLDGAVSTLNNIRCVQLEMSLLPLYDGAPLFEELLTRMTHLKFRLIGLQPGFTDPQTGQLLQVDGIFCSAAGPV